MSIFHMTPWIRNARRKCLHTLSRKQNLLAAFCVTMVMAVYIYTVGMVTMVTPGVNVYVFEEHHEVLQFWNREILHRSIEKSGNTLIHIDAHSDFGLPMSIPGFKFSEWPKTKAQVKDMMQKNDMFILAAVAAGLIDHIVWIWPSWDTSLEPDYELVDFGVGTSRSDGGFCECHTRFQENGVKTPDGTGCNHLHANGDEETLSDPTDCEIVTSIKVEKVADYRALRMFGEGQWLSGHKSVLLDVDEDYFGCASGFAGLTEAGMSPKLADKVNAQVSTLICAKNVTQEALGDQFMKNYIAELIRLCSLVEEDDHCQLDTQELRRLLENHVRTSYEQHPEIHCQKNRFGSAFQATQLLAILKDMPLKRLKAILEVGFCLNMSPVSLGFSQYVEFMLCHGANTPNDTIVPLHTPQQLELQQRIKTFHRLMDFTAQLNPKMVTICRSVRDGYTPRDLANMIEDAILSYFREHGGKVGHAGGYQIIFDDNLLGGELGWNSRHLSKATSQESQILQGILPRHEVF